MKSALIIASTCAHERAREILRIQETADFLLARGWAVDVLVARRTPLLQVALPKGVRLMTPPRMPFFTHPPERPSLRRFCIAVLTVLFGISLASRRAYDVLHGIDDGACIARAIDRGTVKTFVYIAELHNPFSLRGKWRGLRAACARYFERAAMRHAGAIIFSDEETYARMEGPFPKSRAALIPDPHADLVPDSFTRAEFARALDNVYAYILR